MPVGVSVVAQVTTYPFPSRATPIWPQAAVIADIGGRLKSACWRKSAPRDFAERVIWNIRVGAGLIRLGAGELDHLGPLLGFFGNEFPEIGRRA